MKRIGVGIGIHGNGANADAPRRARYPACDLAAIGDENLGEHRGSRHLHGSGRPDAAASQRWMFSTIARNVRTSLGNIQIANATSSASTKKNASGCANAR